MAINPATLSASELIKLTDEVQERIMAAVTQEIKLPPLTELTSTAEPEIFVEAFTHTNALVMELSEQLVYVQNLKSIAIIAHNYAKSELEAAMDVVRTRKRSSIMTGSSWEERDAFARIESQIELARELEARNFKEATASLHFILAERMRAAYNYRDTVQGILAAARIQLRLSS